MPPPTGTEKTSCGANPLAKKQGAKDLGIYPNNPLRYNYVFNEGKSSDKNRSGFKCLKVIT